MSMLLSDEFIQKLGKGQIQLTKEQREFARKIGEKIKQDLLQEQKEMDNK